MVDETISQELFKNNFEFYKAGFDVLKLINKLGFKCYSGTWNNEDETPFVTLAKSNKIIKKYNTKALIVTNNNLNHEMRCYYTLYAYANYCYSYLDEDNYGILIRTENYSTDIHKITLSIFMPADLLISDYNILYNNNTIFNIVHTLAEKYKVSSYCMLERLQDLNVL